MSFVVARAIFCGGGGVKTNQMPTAAQILNPATGRPVKKDGPIGRAIVACEDNKASAKKKKKASAKKPRTTKKSPKRSPGKREKWRESVRKSMIKKIKQMRSALEKAGLGDIADMARGPSDYLESLDFDDIFSKWNEMFTQALIHLHNPEQVKARYMPPEFA